MPGMKRPYTKEEKQKIVEIKKLLRSWKVGFENPIGFPLRIMSANCVGCEKLFDGSVWARLTEIDVVYKGDGYGIRLGNSDQVIAYFKKYKDKFVNFLKNPSIETFKDIEKLPTTITASTEKKYLYKGQIVTASSKEEAIKVLAEKKKAKGKTSYSTVKIGGKQWMSENLKYDDGGDGITYNPKNGEYYYTWDAAMRVAKKLGWKLPSAEDWNRAAEECGAKCINPKEKNIAFRDYEGGNLKEKLKVKLAGSYSESFYHAGSYAAFWTSSESSGTLAYSKSFYADSYMYTDDSHKYHQCSVRLVK